MLDPNTVDKLHAMRFPKMAEAYILQSKDPRYEAQGGLANGEGITQRQRCG